MAGKKKKARSPIPVYRQLRTKLIASFMVPIICIIVLGVVSYTKAADAIIANYEKSVQETVHMTNQYMTLAVDTAYSKYKPYLSDTDLHSYFSGLMGSTPAETLALTYTRNLDSDVDTNALVNNLYFISDEMPSITTGSPSAAALYTAYLETPEGMAVSEDRSTYHLFGNLSDADEALGTNNTKYSLRLAKHMDNCDAIMLIDIDRRTIMDSLAAMEEGSGSYVALVTHDGTEFYSDGTSKDNSLFGSADFYKRIVGSESGGMEYVTYNEEAYLFLYSPMYSNQATQSAMICFLIPESTILEQVAGIKTLAVSLVVFTVVIALILSILLSSRINGNIYYILRQLKSVSDGNLTVQLHSRSKDEFKLLALGVNSMADGMKSLISNVTVASDSLTLAADQVSSSSSSFLKAVENIQDAIEEIETGVSQMDEHSGDCLTQMDSLSAKISHVTGDTTGIVNLTQSAGSSINDGISSMSVLTESAHKTSEITENVIAAIEALSEKSRSIEQIVETINSIAKKTNLLSLNASIEAARAGEAGRGFAVVAEQIRQLADQSGKSAGQIQVIIDDIVVSTSEAVEIAQEAETTVEFQEKAVAQATESFTAMDNQIHSLLESISAISESIRNMEHARSTTLNAIESISSISAETSAGSSHVNRTVTAQHDAIQTLDTAAGTLQKRAAELAALLQQFKI